MKKHLTLAEKKKFMPMIAARDGGYHCLYCKVQLKPRTLIFEHLNDAWWENDVENLVFSCMSCNILKAKGDERIRRLADWKLEDNYNKFMGEKFPDLENKEDKKLQGSKEIDINEKCWDITEEYIREELMKNDQINFQNTLNSCVYLCKKKTGHGANTSIRRHIDALCSPVGPYETLGRGKNRVIVRRISNITPAAA